MAEVTKPQQEKSTAEWPSKGTPQPFTQGKGQSGRRTGTAGDEEEWRKEWGNNKENKQGKVNEKEEEEGMGDGGNKDGWAEAEKESGEQTAR